ncbi:hypothetical protein D9757_004840 [Collybiopsis confluens]|uniref:Alpha/beta hydrolase fold-3 domain-containing protein n=1 Tax=Collybiopsis confluens TaxID=2823264 RepID=A0A8H5HSH3_9AGAR|nr:hypothetical protein D9757_004840 [Collybiopsis confluens]
MHPTTQISLSEKLSLAGVVLAIPFRILASVVLSPLLKQYKKKRLNRVAVEAFTRFFIKHLSTRQLQWAGGKSLEIYKAWAKSKNVQPIVEEVEGKAKLVWLTEKRTDRVLFYVHGGGYMITINDNMCSFGPRMQQELLRRDRANNFGIVALIYSLHPAKFPTQLDELSRALSHLLSSGVKQENLILIGDSAGANLILQLLGHTLHPFEGVAPSPLQRGESSNRLGGVCLVSPWLSLDTPTQSYTLNGDYDVVDPQTMISWGKAYLEGVPQSHLPWIKPIYSGPDSWFTGLNGYTGRVLITAGGKENLLDDSTGLYIALKDIAKSNWDVQLDVEEDGIHEDPIFDANFTQKRGGQLGNATMKIVNWIGEGLRF